MKVIFFCFSLIALATYSHADEWGTWDDLPDDLLDSTEQTNQAIESLYDQLKSNNFDDQPNHSAALETWLLNLDLEFQDNEDIAELLKTLENESDENIAEELEHWLNDQIEDANEELEDQLEDLKKEQDDFDEPDEPDELDDLDPDEIDDPDEPDEPDEPEGSDA